MLLKILGLLGIAGGVAGISYTYNKRLLDWLRFQSLGTRDYVAEKLALMFIEVDPQKVLLWMFAGSFGLGSIVFLAMLPNLLPGLLFGGVVAILGWLAPRPVVDFLYRRRVNKFVLQMVDGLSLMSNGLRSGLSIVQSFGLVTQEMANPIQQEFNLVLNENKLGVSLEEALLNMSKRIKSDDVEMFVTSINILKETGGNLAETFDTIVMTIRDRIKASQKIDAMTSAGFLQGCVVMAVVPILGFVFNESDPGYMRPMFETPLGWILLLVIFLLEVVGFFVITRIIKIDV